jgi:hypothetical protein
VPVRRMDSKRVANQAAFRSVNERISDLNETFAHAFALDAAVICECPDLACSTPISVPFAAYHRIREKPTWFLVLPEHVDDDFEEVIERHAEYAVVAVPDDLVPDLS